jgi:thiamine phosphate synthase YjbQ (UPF0047 family)
MRSPRAGEEADRNQVGDAVAFVRVILSEVVVAITKGKLDFDLWEHIFYGEFDGAAASACW